jgi:hypothetical protein
MTFIKYSRPCKTTVTNDNFAAHVARGSFMPGLDYNCAVGDSVFATAHGKVIMADNQANDGAGITITIRHADGMHSYYYHLSKLLVTNGQHVKLGDKIALSGNTGTQTTGPHLHFALVDGKGKHIDPEMWFKKNQAEERAIRRAERKLAATTVPETLAP